MLELYPLELELDPAIPVSLYDIWDMDDVHVMGWIYNVIMSQTSGRSSGAEVP